MSNRFLAFNSCRFLYFLLILPHANWVSCMLDSLLVYLTLCLGLLSKVQMVVAPKTVDSIIYYRSHLPSGLTTLQQVAAVVGITAIHDVSLVDSLLHPNQELVAEYEGICNEGNRTGETQQDSNGRRKHNNV